MSRSWEWDASDISEKDADGEDDENHVESTSTADDSHTALKVHDWVTITYSDDF